MGVERDNRTYNDPTPMMISTTKVIDEWLGASQDYQDQSVLDSVCVLQYVCALVSERCAALASVCVAELCSRNDKESQTVAVDGSVFKHHPLMKQRMTHYINTFAATKKISLSLAEDGSGKGAAFLAAIVSR